MRFVIGADDFVSGPVPSRPEPGRAYLYEDGAGGFVWRVFGTGEDDTFRISATETPDGHRLSIFGGDGRDEFWSAPGAVPYLSFYGGSVGDHTDDGGGRMDLTAGGTGVGARGSYDFVLHGPGSMYEERGPARAWLTLEDDFLWADGDLGYTIDSIVWADKSGPADERTGEVHAVTLRFHSEDARNSGQTVELKLAAPAAENDPFLVEWDWSGGDRKEDIHRTVGEQLDDFGFVVGSEYAPDLFGA